MGALTHACCIFLKPTEEAVASFCQAALSHAKMTVSNHQASNGSPAES